jgi:hypothetical protein
MTYEAVAINGQLIPPRKRRATEGGEEAIGLIYKSKSFVFWVQERKKAKVKENGR